MCGQWARSQYFIFTFLENEEMQLNLTLHRFRRHASDFCVEMYLNYGAQTWPSLDPKEISLKIRTWSIIPPPRDCPNPGIKPRSLFRKHIQSYSKKENLLYMRKSFLFSNSILHIFSLYSISLKWISLVLVFHLAF